MPRVNAAGAALPARLQSVPLRCPDNGVGAGGRNQPAPVQARTLREIADEAGYTAQNVASLTGLHLSTILRHWHDPRWLEQFEGSSLQRLIVVVPGVDAYVRSYPQRVRQHRLAEQLRAAGIVVDPTGIDYATDELGIAPAFIGNALETTLHLARGDARQAVSYLTTFWGCQQDRALRVLFAPAAPGRLLEGCAPLLAAAHAMHEQLRLRRGFSFPRILAQQVLVHHLARVTGQMPESYFDSRHTRTAFILRGAYMGTIIHSDELALARRYKEIVDSNPVARLIELWSFPTWTRDRNATPDFTLERSLLLRHTAREIISELQHYNEAYVWYLTTTYLPLALEMDPTFGFQLAELAAALRCRICGIAEENVRDACERLVKAL